ncbi:MAG: NAD-glutamate dehydrogenase [Gammaproteobacteria bacterium]|nr:NAD-glutamate dehydrogenase [Gammaproteobacteria bacterium]
MKSDNYRTKLLSQVENSIDATLTSFLNVMPKIYFETNDEETVLQHLSAILIANTSGNQEQIVLANHDASQQTFIHFGSYPGLLTDILDQLPEDRSIQLARAYTADDNSLIIDIFDFDESENKTDSQEIRARQLNELTCFRDAAQDFNPAEVAEFIATVNTHYLQRFNIADIVAHCRLVSKVRGSLDAVTSINPVPGSDRLYYIAYASGQIESTNLFKRLSRYFSSLGYDIRDAFLENFALDTPEQTALVVLQIKINGAISLAETAASLQHRVSDILRLPYLDQSVLDISFNNPGWSLISAEIIVGLCHIAHQIMATDAETLLSRQTINEIALSHESISLSICQAFLKKFSNDDMAASQSILASVDQSIHDDVADNKEVLVLGLLKQIVEATLKSNVYSTKRYALCFRLSPDIFISEKRHNRAFGVFYVHGKAFDGFHVRFQDIARGGVRIVQPSSMEQYAIEVGRLFDEVYDLAYAQQLKNKDIPEGGSKGVILAKPSSNILRCGKSFVDGLLDLIIDNAQLETPRVDYYPDAELLFLGPDENVTNNLIEWIIARAAKRLYVLPNAFMSSKPNAGINHKTYGVTSEGVNIFLEVGLNNIGINPRKESFTIKITGGPDGDVAGNLVKILNREYGENAKIVGIADGSGCAEDPDGLSHQELLRLVENDLPIAEFKKSWLNQSGRVLSIADAGGAEARNTLHNRLESDVFVPAGGRPSTINEHNFQDFLLANGRPSSKLIVEGANLFLTPQARELLTQHGILIVKDSSANKCGVICSSYEIVAGMMLGDEEFLEIKNKFVTEVIEKLQEFAMFEAKTLFREHYFHPEQSLTRLSMSLSMEIIKITDLIAQLIENGRIKTQGFNQVMMMEFFPESLLNRVGDKLLNKLPVPYVIRAMA